MIEKKEYKIKEETYLKGYILTNGVSFSKQALEYSNKVGAKKQNLVYNMPVNSDQYRPQELIIKNKTDGYETVVSCISGPNDRKPAEISVENNKIVAKIEGQIIQNINIEFVKEPEYYNFKMSDGECAKNYVSACGLDELNIIPWKGCAISKGCRFCGINNFIFEEDISAFMVSKDHSAWSQLFDEYIFKLKEAIGIAIKSDCYKEHAHVILIAGNLSKESLDFEADVFSEISKNIKDIVSEKTEEGIVAVITPPVRLEKIEQLKSSGIDKVVFNLEAVTKNGFEKYCPGKNELGFEFFMDRLEYAISIFGKGNVWTNLVFGLEDKEDTLEECEKIINKGIVVGANILHLDKGNRLDCGVPKLNDVIDFYYKLGALNNRQNLKPFYCSKALRTSLSNEVYEKRILEK